MIITFYTNVSRRKQGSCSAAAETDDRARAKWAEKCGWGCCAPVRGGIGGGCVPMSPSNTTSPGPRPSSVPSTWHLVPSSCLATTDMGQNWGLCPLFWGGGAGSLSNTMWPVPRPSSIPSGILIHAAVWLHYTRAEKWGLLCPFRGGGAGSQSNTVWHGPRPTSLLSGILMHPAVWQQQTWAGNSEGERCTPLWGELGPHLTQCGLGRGLPTH